MNTFTAATDAVAAWLVSPLVGCLPLLTFFVMLLAFKASAYVAGLTFARRGPARGGLRLRHAGPARRAGGWARRVYGLFPIVWIVVMALSFCR
ncbi:hypothetical protein QJS66_18400 [Kocuria rhizophila]|nr:hypothetical protein QJS66_18400 [Kocuria rhizophila]